MPYVTRAADGRITGLSEHPAAAGDEFLPAQDPQVLAFLFGGDGAASQFLASDLALIRVVEDMIEVLVRKRSISFTDLPAAAQDKLLERRSMRSYLSNVAGMIDDDLGKLI